MGNYRQHITFATTLGVAYAGAAYFVAGVHWVYGSVAALLATIGGLLPDLDSDSGVEMRGFTGMLGVLTALAVWQHLGNLQPEPAFEYHLWAVVAAYVAVRHFMRRIVSRLSVHRGMSHSLPTCAVWGALGYLHYPSESHVLRLMMAVAIMLGFFSHLLLDEMFSVDIRGARVNRAFGTALKLWAPSAWSTLGIYLLLGFLTWHVVKAWPEGPFRLDPPAPPALPVGLAREVKDVIRKAESAARDAVPLESTRDVADSVRDQDPVRPGPTPRGTGRVDPGLERVRVPGAHKLFKRDPPG